METGIHSSDRYGGAAACRHLWTMAKYDDGLYPGEVRELGDREVKVSVMVKSGKLLVAYFRRLHLLSHQKHHHETAATNS